MNVSSRSSAPRLPRRLGRSVTSVALVIAACAAVTALPGEPEALATPSACVLDITDVIGWWRGEDDLVGEVGPALAGTATFADALVGRGLVLDRSDLSTTSLTPVTDAVSVEAWVRPIDTGVTQTVVSRWDFPSTDDSARSFALFLSPGGGLTWTTDETSARRPVELQASAPQLFDGNFHHMAATWNTSTFDVYVDAVLIASAPSQGGVLNAADSTPIRLGSKSGLGDPLFFSGAVDEATVWRKALSATEIATIVSAGFEGKCSFIPVEKTKLLPTGGTGNSWFGFSVDVDGTSVITGAPLASSPATFSGAAYVFTPGPSGWTQQAKLVPADFAQLDQFGYSVAISGDTAVVGSYGNNGGGTDSGAVYVFVRSGVTWSQQAKLLSNDIAAGDGFGYSVAVSGDTLVVGAPADDDVGSNSGSAYVFTRSGTVWTQQGKLTASDAASADNYGVSVALSGDTVVIGASGDDDVVGINVGAAYVATRTAGVWSEQAKFVPADPAADDQFGTAVGVAGDAALIGAPLDDDAGGESGSAYVFVRSGSGWTQSAKLTAADAASGDRFGISAAIKAGRLVIGAAYDSGTLSQSGSAYVFDGSGATWLELTKLEPADPGTGDRFGFSVAISGDIVVGAYLNDDLGGNSGSVYVFSS